MGGTQDIKGHQQSQVTKIHAAQNNLHKPLQSTVLLKAMICEELKAVLSACNVLCGMKLGGEEMCMNE